MTRDDFLYLSNAGLAVNDNNEPVPENISVTTTFDAVTNTNIERNAITA